MERSQGQNVLRIERTFHAPRAKVYEAWTKAEQLIRWFSPTSEYAIEVEHMDVKTGGSYKLRMTDPEGKVHVLLGEYREVQRPSKLVFTWAWEGTEMQENPTLVTLEFRDVGDSTQMVLTHELFATDQDKKDHTHGWAGCLDRLEQLWTPSSK
jgi:uncharacterized protein YndB with AHSA1/START domain